MLPAVVPVIDDLRAAGMGEVVDDFAARGVEADEVTAELEHIWWVSIARHVADSDPRYGQHDGTGLRSAAEGYAPTTGEHLTATARQTHVEAAAWHTSALEGNRTAAAMLRAEADRAGRPTSLTRCSTPRRPAPRVGAVLGDEPAGRRGGAAAGARVRRRGRRRRGGR